MAMPDRPALPAGDARFFPTFVALTLLTAGVAVWCIGYGPRKVIASEIHLGEPRVVVIEEALFDAERRSVTHAEVARAEVVEVQIRKRRQGLTEVPQIALRRRDGGLFPLHLSDPPADKDILQAATRWVANPRGVTFHFRRWNEWSDLSLGLGVMFAFIAMLFGWLATLVKP